MRTETVTREITEVARPDSMTVEELANGAFKKSLKTYVDRRDKKDCAEASDWLIAQFKALSLIFPSKAAVAGDEVKCLKGQLAEADLEIAKLTDQRAEKYK